MTASTTISNRKFWTEFIELYKYFPELWKIKSDIYKNRNLKAAAYEKLTEKLKEIEPEADREMVRKKINMLRSGYRRELKKLVGESYKAGSGTSKTYEPSLWYFFEIDFLRDDEIQDSEVKTMVDTVKTESGSNEDTTQETSTENWKCFDPLELVSTPLVPAIESSRLVTMANNDEMTERNELLQMASCEDLKASKSEIEIMAKYWAFEFNKLSTEQQIHAKKAINDILYEGRLGALHRHSVTINESQISPHSSTLNFVASRSSE